MTRSAGAAAACHGLALASFGLAHVDREPYDDGHFFKRFAVNALDHGVLAWNLDEGPVYGSTSQVFQLLAVLVTAVTRDHYMLLTRVLAACCLLLGFLVMRRATADRDGGVSAALAFCSPALLFPLLSGMETALTVLGIALVLEWTCPERPARHGAPGAAFVVLVYLIRPDAALLVLPPWLFAQYSATRRLPLREVALLAALLAAALAVLRWYYGNALPLPFYAKQAAFSPYDAHFIAISKEVGLQRFAVFLLCAAPLLLAGLLRRDRVNLVLLGTAFVFVGYHLVATIDVMGMHGRFFVPAMPLLVLASARGLQQPLGPGTARAAALLVGVAYAALAILLWTGDALPTKFVLDRIPRVLQAVLVVASFALFASVALPRIRRHLALGVPLALALGALTLVQPAAIRALSDEDFLALHTSRYTVYRGLDVLRACFGPRIHVYHSEVGLPGLRFQEGKVTDLAGLLSPAWLFRRTSFDAECTREKPEAIFLPHKNYVALNREILGSRCIADYERVVAKSSSPLHVRRDLLPRFRACARNARDPFIALR
jgi:hypothetical protein